MRKGCGGRVGAVRARACVCNMALHLGDDKVVHTWHAAHLHTAATLTNTSSFAIFEKSDSDLHPLLDRCASII